jgi:hypothetical protein
VTNQKPKSLRWLLVLVPLFLAALFGPLYVASIIQKRDAKAKKVRAEALSEQQLVDMSNEHLQTETIDLAKSLDALMLSQQRGDQLEINRAWASTWANVEDIGLTLAQTPSVPRDTEQELVEVLGSPNARCYFSHPNIRSFFATNRDVQQIRANLQKLPEHFQRVWQIVERRLAEPPLPTSICVPHPKRP